MKYIYILFISALLLSSPSINFAQQDALENPQVPQIDRGDGFGENPGDPKKSLVQEVIDIFFGEGLGNSNNTPNPNSSNGNNNLDINNLPETIPSQTPQGRPVDKTFTAIQTFYDYVGGKVGVPQCVIEAISFMEFSSVLKYTPDQVNQYIQPGQVIPNCPWNSCSAAGHMQMTMGIDDRGSSSCNRCCWNGKCQTSCPNAWVSYGNAVNEYDGANYQANVCNLRDSTFAAAKKLKKDSGTAATLRNWDQNAIYRAGERYFGECKTPFAHLGNRTYCEYIIHECSL